MKFFYSSHYQKNQKLIQSELFNELILYLVKHQPPILRELKQKFPQKDFEKKLDQLIEVGVIERNNRRYHLGFTIYSKEDQQQRRQVLQGVAPKSLPEVLSLLGQPRSDEAKFFYACEEDVLQGYAHFLVHESFTLLSLSQEKWPMTIPAYFAANRQLLSLPVYQEMLDIIGDVDEVYYLDQVSVIFERVMKQRKIRPSIFLTSLVKYTVLTETHQFNLPLVNPETIREEKEFAEMTEFDRRTLLADYLENVDGLQNLLISKMIKIS
jgi:hypothetical protein